MKTIEEIAKEHELYTTDNSYKLYAKNLEAFAEAYHKQKLDELEPVAYMYEMLTKSWARQFHRKFKLGDLVKKRKGSEWQGRIVGAYSTDLTPEGYAVESDTHKGSVQIYPDNALEYIKDK